MFSTNINKLKELPYLSPRALAILEPKHNSVMSERQRGFVFSFGTNTNYLFSEVKTKLAEFLKNYYKTTTDFTSCNINDEVQTKPLGKGQKVVVSNLKITPKLIMIELFTEHFDHLSWVTYRFSPRLLFKKDRAHFTLIQRTLNSDVQERFSPQGQSFFYLKRREAKKYFEYITDNFDELSTQRNDR